MGLMVDVERHTHPYAQHVAQAAAAHSDGLRAQCVVGVRVAGLSFRALRVSRPGRHRPWLWHKSVSDLRKKRYKRNLSVPVDLPKGATHGRR